MLLSWHRSALLSFYGTDTGSVPNWAPSVPSSFGLWCLQLRRFGQPGRPRSTKRNGAEHNDTGKCNSSGYRGRTRGIGQSLVDEALRRGARRVYVCTCQPLVHSDRRVTPLALDVTDPEQREGGRSSWIS